MLRFLFDTDTQRLQHLYGAELQEYARQTLAATGNRRRSITLLQGTLAFRSAAPHLRVCDPDAAPLRAKKNAPALIAVESVERLDTDGFRDAAERIRADAGELLPGVEYSEGGDAFSLSFPTEVKPKKAKA
jgi:hypothetical protein